MSDFHWTKKVDIGNRIAQNGYKGADEFRPSFWQEGMEDMEAEVVSKASARDLAAQALRTLVVESPQYALLYELWNIAHAVELKRPKGPATEYEEEETPGGLLAAARRLQKADPSLTLSQAITKAVMDEVTG
jgi:hypothetical protein